MFSMADSAASGEAVVPDRVERRAGLRFDEQSARLGGGVGVGVRFEFVEAEVALPNAVCEGRGVCHASDVSRAGLKAFCMFFPALSPDSVDNRITAFE